MTPAQTRKLQKMQRDARRAAVADLPASLRERLVTDLTGPQVAYLNALIDEARRCTDLFWQARALDALAGLLDATHEINNELEQG